MIIDMHVHTKYSCDSRAELESYCLQAIKTGAGAICFTDHIDCNVNDFGYGYYNAVAFFNDFLPLKEKYKNDLTLLCGIEFAEPHLYPEKLAEHTKLPYDYILGSIHFWYNDMFPTQMIDAKIPVEVCYRHYWSEVLAAVKAGGFDAFAHLDFPKRYYGEVLFDPEILHEICRRMVKNNICPEINTSSLRQGGGSAMPDKDILSIYKSCGGKYVTVGSDAHKAGDLAAGYPHAKGLIEYFGFTEVYFSRRRPIYGMER